MQQSILLRCRNTVTPVHIFIMVVLVLFSERFIHCQTGSLLLQILPSLVWIFRAVGCCCYFFFTWSLVVFMESEESPIQLEILPLANTKNSMSFFVFVTLYFVFRAELLKTSHIFLSRRSEDSNINYRGDLWMVERSPHDHMLFVCKHHMLFSQV